MYQSKTSRRQFLIGLSGFALSLPLLPSLLPRAYAAGGRARRFIGVFHGNGTDIENFWPANVPMVNITGGQAGVLTNVAGDLSPIIGAPFNSLKDKMNILWGLNRDKAETNFHGHNPMICLTGCNVPDHDGGTGRYIGQYPAWPSLDQVFANSPIIYPSAPPLRDVHLLSRRAGAFYIPDRRNAISFKAVGGQFVDNLPETDPRVIFDRAFGGQTQQADVMGRYQKVVDKVLADYQSVRANRRISAEDKLALDIHMEHLNQLESNLVALGPPTCTPGARPGGNSINFQSRTEADTYVSNHIDLIVSLIRCDLTNVVTFMLNTPTDTEKFTFLPGYRNLDFHSESHFGTGEAGTPDAKGIHYTEIYKWLTSKLAELANKLNTPEANGSTFLDNSLILFSNSQGAGNHTGENIPVILLGSAGGALRTNQYIRYNNQPVYNQVLVTAAQAMGLMPSDYRQGGRVGFGTYARPEFASDTPLSNLIL